MPTRLKAIEFEGSSLDDLKAFPQTARREAGFQLDRVQRGLQPDDWRPMSVVGAGAYEIRVRDQAGAFRIIYVAKFDEAIYVLHAFQKTTQQTSQTDIDLASDRYRSLARRRK